MNRIILTLSFLLMTIVADAQYPSINSARPRIYADANRISWMRENYNIPGDFKTDYDNFITRYNDNWISDPELYMLGNDQSIWT